MITQRELGILTDVIKQQSGLDVPPNAALAALYALADYNFSLIRRKPEPHKYGIAVHKGGAGPEPDQ
jgi:hypothetical protein